MLRDYQIKAKQDLRAALKAGKRAPLLVAATGSGKTSIAADLIHSATSKGAKVHMIAHRKELIEQASKRLDSVGVDHGIIKASHPRRRPWLPVQVCSIQTLVRREKLLPADIIIVDEAHRAVAESYRKVIDRYPNAIVLGLTATPVRSTGEGLGKPGGLFDCLIECPSIGELTDMGYLVPTRIYAPNKPDLRGVHTQAGDYKPDELARAVDKPKLTGDIIDHWKRLGQNRQTICFAVNVEHSQHLASEFMRAGIPAMHLDAETPDDERDEILAMLESGRVRVLCNVGILTEGWDMPVVSCCILARPTQSLGLYLQCVGRVLRPVTEQDWLELCRKHPYYGMQVRKTDALILDHSGCVSLHGFPDEEREWSLDGTWKRKAKPGASEVPTPVVCKKCLMCFPSTDEKCPSCGWVRPKQKREIKHEDGELEEITRGARTAEKWRELPETARISHYRRLLAEQQTKGYKPNYAKVCFHRIYGVWPKKDWEQQPVGVAV